MTIFLVDCTSTICREIELGMTQSDVAVTYAAAIKSEAAEMDAPDWRVINQAIVDRWSRSGLKRIKRLAWERRLGQSVGTAGEGTTVKNDNGS